ncbi:hypothetical protein AAHE18_03G212900 [Arachis hypogaea]
MVGGGCGSATRREEKRVGQGKEDEEKREVADWRLKQGWMMMMVKKMEVETEKLMAVGWLREEEKKGEGKSRGMQKHIACGCPHLGLEVSQASLELDSLIVR